MTNNQVRRVIYPRKRQTARRNHLSESEEVALFKKYKDDTGNRRPLTEGEKKIAGVFAVANTGLVAYQARKMYAMCRQHYHICGPVDLEDFMQEGQYGQSIALVRFDTGRGTKFSTYAPYWIKHAIDRAVYDRHMRIRIPFYLVEASSRILRFRREFEMKNGREPTKEEISDKLEIRMSIVERALEVNTRRVYTVVGNDDKETDILDLIACGKNGPEKRTEKLEIEQLVPKLLKCLTDQEKDVIRKRFGLGQKEKTLDQVGKDYHVTRERIRQIQEKALGKMRKVIEDEGMDRSVLECFE